MSESTSLASAGRVSILIITYRRPRQLLRLLMSLEALDFRSVPEPTIEVVVVDNDPGGAGAAAARRHLEGGCRWPLTTGIELRPGISEARNRALTIADRPDFVAFVDDDEYVSPLWLDELLRVQRQMAAHAVAGPVLPELSPECPEWIRLGGFFDRERHSDAASVGIVASGNLLLSTAMLRSLGEPTFDPAFSFTGGEDTHLALRLRRAGARMHWADRAVAWEAVPFSRTNGPWLIRRWFRMGGCLTLAERAVDWSYRKRIERTFKGIARIGLGTVLVIASVPMGRARVFRSLKMLMMGAGMLSALFGVRYQEYARS